MPRVTLPDGSCLDMPDGSSAADVAARIGPGLARAALGARADFGTGPVTLDLSTPLRGDCRLSIITEKDPDSLSILRHSTAHVMAEAICTLWPETLLVYGPPVEDGFYYDIDLKHRLTPEDFGRIETEMARIVREDRPFTRYELSREAGMAKLQKEGNPYKVENALRARGDRLSFYVTGPEPGRYWEDLCMGTHIPRTGSIGAFKVLSVAGAYLHGDATKKQLQRVYGTAFHSRKELDEYLRRLEEAKKRDHRRIGQELNLFTIDPLVGSGMVLWKPRGATIRLILENHLRGELVRHGYQPVFTPHIGRLELWRTSGHYPYYKDSQFAPIRMDDGEEFLLKPMNCPIHVRIYASEPRSYRDLPVRLAEFGTVYRFEQSGELSGMTRVRGFTQDDAHLFVTPEQLQDELRGCLTLTRFVLDTVGLKDYRVRIGLHKQGDPKYIDNPQAWAEAEAAVIRAAEDAGLPATKEVGEAAFYGPKIDFVVKDCIGREWQLGTVQADYNLPERFGLEYIGRDNRPHRPIMIHRAPFGSMERFVGILIEHFAGAFPTWLSPVQVRVATISEKSAEYARSVLARLSAAGLRADLDDSPEKIGPKKHRARAEKIPYIAVVGEEEARTNSVNLNDRDGRQLGNLTLDAFLARLTRENVPGAKAMDD